MYISENLHYLRKRDKITQEELAERLGVSRQSVSKWETGEAYPETDKLITLCDIFNVTLDELMRTDLTAADVAAPTCDNFSFAAHMDKFSRAMATGVFLILFGTAVCVAIGGLGMMNVKLGPVSGVLSGVAVLTFVAAAVFLFIYYGMQHERFKKENPVIESFLDENTVKAFYKKFNIVIACLVSGILIDVVFLVIMSCFVDAQIIKSANQDAAYCFITGAFLAVLSFIVGGLVYYGIQHSKYDIAEYNKQTSRELHPSSRSKLKDALCGAVMLCATALFLGLGFIGHLWHPGWVVFPIGGIICAIINAIMGAKDDN